MIAFSLSPCLLVSLSPKLPQAAHPIIILCGTIPRMPIRVLSEQLASQIAAGEVVERPSSVVKELVENSIDAGATTVNVDIREAGRKSIQIADNGSGISASEIETAFLRHATSKLQTVDDLNAHWHAWFSR